MSPLHMHIMLDSLINKVNSNVWGDILPEEKDNFINEAIINYVRTEIANDIENNTTLALDTLQTLIRTKKITKLVDYVYPYTKYVDLLTIGSSITNKYMSTISNTIIAGLQYRIVTLSGNDSFAEFNNGIIPILGDIFIASWQVKSERQPTFAVNTYLSYDYDKITNTPTLLAGKEYKVLNGVITFNYTTLGVYGITVNGVLYNSANCLHNIQCTSNDIFTINDVKVTASNWVNGSILELITTEDIYFAYCSSSSETKYQCGNSQQTNVVTNRIVKRRNYETTQQYSNPSNKLSPLGFIENNKLVLKYTGESNVPINDKFTIESVYVTYYKQPQTVSLSGNIHSDLSEIVQTIIIRNCAETILSAINSGTFEKLRLDSNKVVTK